MFGYTQEQVNQKIAEALKEQKLKLEALQKSFEITTEDYTREKANLIKDHEIALQRKTEEVDSLVYQKTKELTAELAKKTSEYDIASKEVEILTKAFENLGFDVKDMKEILNKLVDGIVSKNQIQLVK